MREIRSDDQPELSVPQWTAHPTDDVHQRVHPGVAGKSIIAANDVVDAVLVEHRANVRLDRLRAIDVGGGAYLNHADAIPRDPCSLHQIPDPGKGHGDDVFVPGQHCEGFRRVSLRERVLGEGDGIFFRDAPAWKIDLYVVNPTVHCEVTPEKEGCAASAFAKCLTESVHR